MKEAFRSKFSLLQKMKTELYKIGLIQVWTNISRIIIGGFCTRYDCSNIDNRTQKILVLVI